MRRSRPFLASVAALALATALHAQEVPSTLSDVPYLEAGRTEKLDLYLPERAPDDPPAPAVVWIHGGGWLSGSKSATREQNVGYNLSAAGYVVASVAYKLGPSSWPTNLYDCKNAVRFLRVNAAKYHLDADRIAVMGGSAGGHLALMMGLTAGEGTLEPKAPYPGISDEVSAIGDFYGITDLLTREEVDKEGHALGQPTAGMEKVFGKSRTEDPTLWKDASPVNHVHPDSPPVFITQGFADPTVDHHQSIELDRMLTAQGVPHEMILLPDVGHTYDLTTWNKKPLPRDLRSDVIAFLQRYVGIPAHGVPPGPIAASPRLEVDLDQGWKFFGHDNSHSPEPGFDDSGWQSVAVPHTWTAQDGQDGGSNYRRGGSWYRRHVTIDSRFQGKQLYLQFDGAAFQADVYVNGKKLGSHLGGFARFRFDATDALKPGDNLIAVLVDNGPLGIAPISADFTFFGGLYRPVKLIATDPLQIAMMDQGSPGVFVDQTDVSATRADFMVRTEIENHADKQRDVEVVALLFDAAGHPVAHDVAKQRMGSGDRFTAVQRISLEHPHLWDGRADPYLYTLQVTLRVGGEVRDSVTQPAGFRFFKVDPYRGFFLNGRPLDLHGVNRHQDRIDRGWAIRPADEAEDFTILKNLGCTAVRTSHYQQAQTWYERCDRAGIVAWAEIPFVNNALPRKAFLDNAKDQLRELIRQNYNHPSICFWSVGNETRDPSPATKESVSDHVVAELADVAKAEDGTRLSTYASDEKESEDKNWHTDVVAFNHYAGWYTPEVHELAGYLDDIHEKHPARAFGISEYGAGASINQHQLPAPHPQANHEKFHPEEYQSYLHEQSWPVLAARPYLWGKFVWCLFDFASDGRNEGDHPGLNDKGLVTYDRRDFKDAYFYYQAQWTNDPLVHVTSKRFLVRHRPTTEVKVYSTSSEVTLRVNGTSLGSRRSATGVFEWRDVALRLGANQVSASAQFGDASVTDACTWIYEQGPSKAVQAKLP